MKRNLLALCAVLAVVLLALPLPTIRAGADQSIDVETMIKNAKTPADHEAIAAYYDGEAQRNKADAASHRKLAKTYRDLRMKPTDMWHHCEQMANYFDSLAKDASALAIDHRRMAQSLKQ